MELLPLVCLCLLSCSGDAVRVVVEEGSDAVLPCLISPKEDISGELLVWKKDGQGVFLYDSGLHYFNSFLGFLGEDDQFTDRVSIFEDQLENGDASIKITGAKMADSGNYSCDFPRHQPSQTSIIELVVDRVLKDRTGENIPGAAPQPVIKTLAVTKDGVLLQCDARGVSPLTVELKNAAGNILNSLSTPISETGRPSSITLNIAVTKTDNYSCVATQKQFSHQVAAVIPVNIEAVRVVVEEDSDAVLPCLISPKEDISGKLLVWKKDGQKKMKQVFTHDTSDKFANRDQDEQFKGRVSVFEDQLQNGNASIKITGTKMADSGTYSCDFPRHQPRQTSFIELVVDQVLKDRRGEISGAAAKPVVKILAVTKDGVLLQCEAHGDPRPTIKWQDSDNKTLPAEEPKISDRGGRFYITGKINVTKTDNYSCVATQETRSHQVAAVTSVYIQGASKPSVKTIKTDKGVMLQCEVLGASPKPKVEWKDSSGNILKAEEPQVTERGGSYNIVLRAAVTKTDTFRCVVTQEEISHQAEAETYASVSGAAAAPGSNTGLLMLFLVLLLLF